MPLWSIPIMSTLPREAMSNESWQTIHSETTKDKAGALAPAVYSETTNCFESLGRIQDLTKGRSDKRPPKAVAPMGVRGRAPLENF